MIRDIACRHARRTIALLMGITLVGCVAPPLPDSQVLVFGEQHDQPDQQRQVARVVRQLADAGHLGAVVIEMAERGHSTTGLATDADAATVRGALAWTGWDWSAYEPVVMAAVRAGVEVRGGNLPHSALRETMTDSSQDALIDAAARERIAAAVRQGHCGALPPEQEPGMVRIQIARDHSMADTIVQALVEARGRQVLLLTGAQHASRDRGVPLHLAREATAPSVHVVVFGSDSAGLVSDERRPAESTPRSDPCAGLRERLAAPPKPSS
jgi:uncharacterized iron-regulated protein